MKIAKVRPLPERIRLLRDELFTCNTQTCFERAKAVTRSYKSTEGESTPIRRAKALKEIFCTVPIYLRPQELLVGSRSSRLGDRTAYPEYTLDTPGDWPQEVLDYWKGNTLGDLSLRLHPPAVSLADREKAAGYATGTSSGFGHVIVDYEKAIYQGFRSIIDDAKERMKSAQDDPAGMDFLQSVVIACEGIIAWANRYADLAEEEAKSAIGIRREELLQMAAVCRRVPEFPARTFHEALQSFWFVHIAMHIEQKGWSVSTGRFDQYMYPFYKADVESGTLSEDQAFELLLSLWVKFMENVDEGLKMTTFQNMTIGGQDANGKDVSNAMSHLCMDATIATRFTQPALSARWFDGVDEDYWLHVMETISCGLGMPALFNDKIIMDALTYNGIPKEDAWNYGIVGCVEACIPGKEQGMTAGGHINVAKALELALFDGKSLTSGLQIGLHTGDAAQFASFDQLWAAYEKQSKYLAALNITAAQIAGDVQKQLGHCPLMSALLSDCLERHRDLVEGGTKYSLSGIAIMGATNACDGLMILKNLVFRQKQYTMAEVCRALEADFDGYEDMRQVFLNHDCRYGNDVSEADEMANAVYAVHADFSALHPDPRGGHYTCGIWPVNGHVHSGYHTGASPDGRHKGTPLVDGVGACQGVDRNGPTALLKSVARLNNVEHWAAGNTCNVKFSKTSVHSPNGVESMKNLVEVFMILGGQELQINVVDGETLRAAQQNPEEYADLVVRVAGYSAYFTTLNKDVQNEIISRMEQAV